MARDVLAGPLPRTWERSRVRAERVRWAAERLAADAGVLESAGWLCDVGFAPGPGRTGCVPLDGARRLRAAHAAPDPVCSLVAYHSGAVAEADARGLLAALEAEFGPPEARLLDVLTYADMTTGADGAVVAVETRIGELLAGGDRIHYALRRTAPELRAAVQRVESALAAEALKAPPAAT